MMECFGGVKYAICFLFFRIVLKNILIKFFFDKNIRWTYSDIYKKAIFLAKYLRRYGLKEGDRVVIYLDNSVEYAAAYFSISLANGVIVPINKNTTIDNIKYIIQDTSPEIIISNEIF